MFIVTLIPPWCFRALSLSPSFCPLCPSHFPLPLNPGATLKFSLSLPSNRAASLANETRIRRYADRQCRRCSPVGTSLEDPLAANLFPEGPRDRGRGVFKRELQPPFTGSCSVETLLCVCVCVGGNALCISIKFTDTRSAERGGGRGTARAGKVDLL